MKEKLKKEGSYHIAESACSICGSPSSKFILSVTKDQRLWAMCQKHRPVYARVFSFEKKVKAKKASLIEIYDSKSHLPTKLIIDNLKEKGLIEQAEKNNEIYLLKLAKKSKKDKSETKNSGTSSDTKSVTAKSSGHQQDSSSVGQDASASSFLSKVIKMIAENGEKTKDLSNRILNLQYEQTELQNQKNKLDEILEASVNEIWSGATSIRKDFVEYVAGLCGERAQ